MVTQLCLLQVLLQSSAQELDNALGLNFIVAVTKPEQSPTSVEREMTAISKNKNV